MRRVGYVLLGLLAAAAVAGAGYFGLRSGQPEAPPAVEAPATVAVTRGDVQQTVTAPGELVGTRRASLAFDVDGKLAEVRVRPGQAVQAGEVLAQIEAGPLAEAEVAAEAALAVAQARLEKLEAGPSAAELAAAQLDLAAAQADEAKLRAGAGAADLAAADADVASAEAGLAELKARPDPAAVLQARIQLERATVALQRAQDAYDQVKEMPGVGMMPQALELQQATIDYNAAKAALDLANRRATPAELAAAQARLSSARAARARLAAGASAAELKLAELRTARAAAALEQVQAGPGAADLAQARASVAEAQAGLARAQAAVRAAALTAPFAGTVIEVNAAAGETVRAGAALVVLTDPGALEVETSVVEEDLPLVAAGQPVELYFDAAPDAAARGAVDRIVPQRLAGDRPLFPVYIHIDQVPAGLQAGMTADASIVIAARSGVLRLPRAVVRARSDGTAVVRVWTGSREEERAVRVGLRGDVYVEIVEGLQEGEWVVAQ